MHYAKAKDGTFPAMPKGEEVKEPKTLEENEAERAKDASSLIVEADKKAKEIPKGKEVKKKR